MEIGGYDGRDLYGIAEWVVRMDRHLDVECVCSGLVGYVAVLDRFHGLVLTLECHLFLAQVAVLFL